MSHAPAPFNDSSADGYFQIYEGGENALNDSRTSYDGRASMNESLKRKATVDIEKSNRFKEEYYESLLNKSVNRHEALDLFLLLDEENDQFLKYEELKAMWPIIENLHEVDRGPLKTEEEFKEKFDSFGKFQMDRRTFNEFVDSIEIDVRKVRDKFYAH